MLDAGGEGFWELDAIGRISNGSTAAIEILDWDSSRISQERDLAHGEFNGRQTSKVLFSAADCSAIANISKNNQHLSRRR
jgi:hypothetical protein